MPMLTPALAHAREVASSPSGWAMAWMPAGETHSGKVILLPKHSTLVSALETSMRTRLRTRYFWYAAVFSLMVI